MAGGFLAWKASDDEASNGSYGKSQRDQTRAKGNGVIPFVRVWSLLPGSFSPHELLVRRSLLAKMLSATGRLCSTRQKKDPLANDMLPLIWFRVGYVRFDFDLSKIQISYRNVEKKRTLAWQCTTWTFELPAILFETERVTTSFHALQGTVVSDNLFSIIHSDSFCLWIPFARPSSHILEVITHPPPPQHKLGTL